MEKLLIPEIGLFDPETEKFFFGNAIFRETEIAFFSDDFELKIPILSRHKIIVDIDQPYPSLYSLHIHTSYLYAGSLSARFLLKESISYNMSIQEKISSITNYYSELNDQIARNNVMNKSQIIEIFDAIPRKDYFKISQNFFQLLPGCNNYFLRREYYCGIEALISFSSYYSSFFIDSDENAREEVIERYSKDNVYANIVNHFIDEFNKFSLVIARKYTITDDFRNSISWLILKNSAIEFFSNKWNDNYGYMFAQANIASFNDAINCYINCDCIEHDNEQTASLFTYFLMEKGILDNNNYITSLLVVLKNIADAKRQNDMLNYEKKLLSTCDSNDSIITIDDIDLMSGDEFEEFVAELFRKIGYVSNITKHSGDQGVDVIIEKNGVKIGIQAKCYAGSVGNSAIQEVVAGKSYYGLNKAIVITNSFFTKQAIELADSNNVILWDRNMLKEKISSACF